MIIDLTPYNKNQEKCIQEYFKEKEKMPCKYGFLPSCLRDFIKQHTGLYILIEKLLHNKNLSRKHISLAKNMIEKSEKVHIHPPKSENTDVYFEKLIEKAEHSNSPTAVKLADSIHSLSCDVLENGEGRAFQTFKKCFANFVNQELNRMINEVQASF